MSFGQPFSQESVPRFIPFSRNLVNFKKQEDEKRTRLVSMCTYAYSPRCIARAYTARVKSICSFLFRFTRASERMSKDYSPRFFVACILLDFFETIFGSGMGIRINITINFRND